MKIWTKAQIARTLRTAEYGSKRLLDAVEAALDAGGELEGIAIARCLIEARREAEQAKADRADLARHWPKKWSFSAVDHAGKYIHY